MINSHENTRILRLMKNLISNSTFDLSQKFVEHNTNTTTVNAFVYALIKLNIDAISLFITCKAYAFNLIRSTIAVENKRSNEKQVYSVTEWISGDTVSTVCEKKNIVKLLENYESIDGKIDVQWEQDIKYDDYSASDPSLQVRQTTKSTEKEMKQIFETMLYDAFMEHNFVLFDILIDLWQNSWSSQYPHDTINIAKFGANNGNIIEMIANEHGSGENEKNLSMSLALFEKYTHLYQHDVDIMWNILTNAFYHHQYLFISKLVRVPFTINQQCWENAFAGGGLFYNAIAQAQNVNDVKKAMDTLDTFFNVNKEKFQIMNHTTVVSYELFKLILDHPNAVQWLKWLFLKHEFKYDKSITVETIMEHPCMFEIIDVLITSRNFAESITTNSCQKLIVCTVNYDNFYFLEHIQKAYQIVTTNLDKIGQKLLRVVASSKIIGLLETYGWTFPSFEELITTKDVSACLIHYVIERQDITIGLNHLQSRMQHLCTSAHEYYFDVLHVLLVHCPPRIRNKFCMEWEKFYDDHVTNPTDSKNDNYKKVRYYLKLFFKYTFDIACNISIDDYDATTHMAYYSAKQKSPKVHKENIPNNKQMIERLLDYHMEIVDTDDDILSTLISQNGYAGSTIFRFVYQNNFDRFKLILDSAEASEQQAYLCYKMAVFHDNKEMIDYSKYYTDNKKWMYSSRFDWSCVVDNDDNEYSDDVKEIDVSGEDMIIEYYEISMTVISNSLLKLYQRYISDVDDNVLKNEFITNVYYNKKYFHNLDYKYYLKSPLVGTIISTRKTDSGICLFHSIASSVNFYNILIYIMKQINDNYNDCNKLLLCDNDGTIVLQRIVFGSYNEKYQRLKFSSKQTFEGKNEQVMDVVNDNSNQNDLEQENKISHERIHKEQLFDLLHQMMTQTIEIKLKHIL